MMAFDYSGFGVSTGHSNEQTIYENIDAVYRYMLKNLGVLEGDVILIGFSMGTAAVIDLAAKQQKVHSKLCCNDKISSVYSTASQIPSKLLVI
uniref:AB hydrolase-1 domain-containing protein n=1 Tax=Parascaris univalens TaxID=6257 RepID=A0A915A3M8_PARUN